MFMGLQHRVLFVYYLCQGALITCLMVSQEDILRLACDRWALSCLMSVLNLPRRSDALIEWAAGGFPRACFVLYEQVRPRDPFGRVMQQHFSRRNSALRSLARYPDCGAQHRRFLEQAGPCRSRACGTRDGLGKEGDATGLRRSLAVSVVSRSEQGRDAAFSSSMSSHSEVAPTSVQCALWRGCEARGVSPRLLI